MRVPLTVTLPSTAPFVTPVEGNRALQGLTRSVEGSLLRHARRQRMRAASRHAVPADPNVMKSLLSELDLDTYEPLLSALPPSMVSAIGRAAQSEDAPDLRVFVRSISNVAATNPLLCQLAHKLSTSSDELEPVKDVEMYELAHYILLLDAVTRALAADAELAAAVYARLREAVRSTAGWWQPLGLFELAKLCTVEMTLERFVEHRRFANLPSNFGHLGLPFNILEAVLQDLKLGFTSNAAAGLALCVARPGQPSADRPGRGASLSTDGRRAVRMHLPHEKEWTDLYVSWNLAFTTAYADVPTRFGAPLLAPCVLGAPPDEFMFHRVLALHTHMCFFIRRRAHEHASAAAAPSAPSASLPAFLSPAVAPSAGAPVVRLNADDRRRRSLTEHWGSINLAAAQRYERRLRLYPFVATAKLGLRSAFSARSVPYPYSLILPPPRTVFRGVVMATRPLSARERAERRQHLRSKELLCAENYDGAKPQGETER
jgi:hypothetical protein